MALLPLDNYFSSLYDTTQAASGVWFEADGRARGRYFNATLTSVFQPIRILASNRVVGFEGYVRSDSTTDQGLNVWKLLDGAASDIESIELDRLCRMLHAINFFRQAAAQSADLFISVHARLLAAVQGNHGNAFRRILESLELSHERIVLQLPAVTHNQNWILNVISKNYRGNGFRLAVNANTIDEALSLLDCVRPDAIKLDARQIGNSPAMHRLLAEAAKRETRIIFKRVETVSQLSALRQIGDESGNPIHVQGFLWDLPHALLVPAASSGTHFRGPADSALGKKVA